MIHPNVSVIQRFHCILIHCPLSEVPLYINSLSSTRGSTVFSALYQRFHCIQCPLSEVPLYSVSSIRGSTVLRVLYQRFHSNSTHSVPHRCTSQEDKGGHVGIQEHMRTDI